MTQCHIRTMADLYYVEQNAKHLLAYFCNKAVLPVVLHRFLQKAFLPLALEKIQKRIAILLSSHRTGDKWQSKFGERNLYRAIIKRL